MALYSDRHSLFRVNRADLEEEPSQFCKALKPLQIHLIHAHSPQAKGRIECACSTLQGRLTRELRLRDIDDMEAANAWLAEQREDVARGGGRAPGDGAGVRRPGPHHVRTLTRSLTFKFRNGEYGIQGEGRELEARLLAAGPPPVPLDDDKSANRTVEEAWRKQRAGRASKPAQDHAWNAMARGAARVAEVRQSQAGR